MTERLPMGLLIAPLASLGAGFVLATRGAGVFLTLAVATAGAALVSAILRRPVVGAVTLIALLAAFPIARIEFGPLPIYLSDVLVAATLGAIGLRAIRTSRPPTLLVLFLFAWLPAWVVQVAQLGVVLEPTYGLLRNVTAVSAFFIAYVLVRRGLNPEAVAVPLAVGILITAALSIAQTAPPTAGAVRDLVFAVAPDFAENGYAVYPRRSFALFAAPTALAAFLATALPILVTSLPHLPRHAGRILVAVAIPASGIALLTTYSRQWLPAAAVGLLTLGAVSRGGMRQALIAAGAISFVAWLAVAGGAVDQSYLAQRFERLGPDDANVQTRLERQRAFFSVARNDPSVIAVGRGFAGQDILARNVIDDQRATQLRAGVSDNSFLLEVFNHGIFAGVFYVLLIGGAFIAAAGVARAGGSAFAGGVSAAIATAATLHFFDNHFSEAVFLKTFFWLLLGFAYGLARSNRTHPRAT